MEVTNTRLRVPIFTSSKEDNVKLTKQLSQGFKRSLYWNQFKTEIKTRELDNNNPVRVLVDCSLQEAKRVLVLAFSYTNINDYYNLINNIYNKVKKRATKNNFFQE